MLIMLVQVLFRLLRKCLTPYLVTWKWALESLAAVCLGQSVKRMLSMEMNSKSLPVLGSGVKDKPYVETKRSIEELTCISTGLVAARLYRLYTHSNMSQRKSKWIQVEPFAKNMSLRYSIKAVIRIWIRYPRQSHQLLHFVSLTFGWKPWKTAQLFQLLLIVDSVAG